MADIAPPHSPVPHVTSIHPRATPEEIAAITAALAVIDAEQRVTITSTTRDSALSMWVEASRRAAQRAGLQRGPWRLSGRITRRSRT